MAKKEKAMQSPRNYDRIKNVCPVLRTLNQPNVFFLPNSAATLKSIDDLGEGMVRDGTKCGSDKVPRTKFYSNQYWNLWIHSHVSAYAFVNAYKVFLLGIVYMPT